MGEHTEPKRKNNSTVIQQSSQFEPIRRVDIVDTDAKYLEEFFMKLDFLLDPKERATLFKKLNMNENQASETFGRLRRGIGLNDESETSEKDATEVLESHDMNNLEI